MQAAFSTQGRVLIAQRAEPAQEMGVTAQLRELAHFGERRVQIGEEAVGCASIVAHGVGAEGVRHRGMLPNTCFMASGVVASLCSKTISPASFKTQYALVRSPRSNPMVSRPSKMFFPLVRIVLIFCIAGLLFFVP